MERSEILVVMILIFLIAVWVRYGVDRTETFSGGGELVASDPVSIYDDFYAGIYPQLFHHAERHQFELDSLSETIFDDSSLDGHVLDIGCGLGPYASAIAARDMRYTGLDISPAMIKKAKQGSPAETCQWIQGDSSEPSMMSPKSFSHILCMYFSVYQFQDLRRFLTNAYSWLRPGGYLVVHVVNPEKFDPVLDAASPFPAFSLQKYANRRVTSSEVDFDKFKYQCRFQKDPTEAEATFDEIFTLPDGSKRRNRHRLFMPPVSQIQQVAKSVGFKEVKLIDMVTCHFEYQYLLVLQRA